MSLAFLLDGADPAKRAARLRELRLLAAGFLGRGDVATRALTEAVADGAAAERALQLLDEAAALPRRRILAVYGSAPRNAQRWPPLSAVQRPVLAKVERPVPARFHTQPATGAGGAAGEVMSAADLHEIANARTPPAWTALALIVVRLRLSDAVGADHQR